MNVTLQINDILGYKMRYPIDQYLIRIPFEFYFKIMNSVNFFKKSDSLTEILQLLHHHLKKSESHNICTQKKNSISSLYRYKTNYILLNFVYNIF